MLPFVFHKEENIENDWIYKSFEIETIRDYNEYVYFYNYVRDALYNKNEEKKEDFISKY
jgi:hypothetical protein